MVKPPEIIKIKQTNKESKRKTRDRSFKYKYTYKNLTQAIYKSQKHTVLVPEQKRSVHPPLPLAVGPSGPCAPGDRSFCRSLVKSSEWLGRGARLGQDSIGPGRLGPGRGLAAG